MNCPNYRQVLDCASPLALLKGVSHVKAAEGRRTPRRYRANQDRFRIMVPIRNVRIVEAFHESLEWNAGLIRQNRASPSHLRIRSSPT